MGRALCWFSCGAPSAVTAKLTLEKYGKRAVVAYCDTFAWEHPDNKRFFRDVCGWLGYKIKILRSEKYIDIYDVFDETGWLVGPAGARCTTELKKVVRQNFQEPDDIHMMGYTFEEKDRIDKFEKSNPEIYTEHILYESKLSRADCMAMVTDAGIELPKMYQLGYKNNNCIGCVKGQQGYWNKIRKDFPEYFEKMAQQERKMDVAINKRYEGKERIRVFLDELDPNAGRYETEADISCGVYCQYEMELVA